MNIKMMSTQMGSVDGVRLSAYEEGKEYDLTNNEGERDLARVFVAEGWATEVPRKKAAAESVEGEGSEAVGTSAKKAKK